MCTHSVHSVSVSPSQPIHSVTLFRSILGTGDLYIYIGHIDDAMCDPNMCLSGSVSVRRLDPGSFECNCVLCLFCYWSRCWDSRWRLLWIATQSICTCVHSPKQEDRKLSHTYPCVWLDEMSRFNCLFSSNFRINCDDSCPMDDNNRICSIHGQCGDWRLIAAKNSK